MDYIKLKISKKAGFWRYKVEVELNLPSQPQASYIKEITVRGKSYSGMVVKTGVKREYGSMILGIADSNLYWHEDPTDKSCSNICNLCLSVYLSRLYQKRIEFYLDFDVDINEVIDAFENLDNEVDKMVQAPGTPAFNYFLNETKYIKLKISKRAGFWRYKVEIELNLQPQPQAPFIEEIVVRGAGHYGIIRTGIRKEYKLIALEIIDSSLYHYEDPMSDDYSSMYNLCSSMYLIKPCQRKVEFYLEYDVNIDRVIDVFKDLDYKIDEMVQELGTPAFDYFLNETKYIKLKISKKAGFWRYKVEVELNLPSQPQASYIKEIVIRGRGYYGITETEVKKGCNWIALEIVDSELYYYEDLVNNSYTDTYSLCSPMYLTKSYQKKVEFYLGYRTGINEVIDAFRDLDNGIDEMVQESGTPAFSYLQTETKYIKLGIFKRVGFWRYKVEVELDLQPQPQASYIKKEIVIEGRGGYGITEVGVKEKHNSIVLEIVKSVLYYYEDPMDNNYNRSYSLCCPIYLTKPYQKKVEFYLEYDIDINKVIDAFKNLDDEINKMVQVLGTPAFNYSQTGAKYIKLDISKRVGFWRYKVKVELNLQFQSQLSHLKRISIKGKSCKMTKTGVSERQGSIVLGIVNSELYYCEDPTDNSYVDLYNLYPSSQRKIEFYLEYNIDINEVINAFKDFDDVIDRKIQISNISASN